ncbi:hypothetical protein LshimejAT787_3200080 [Lyophyllum shimeji]|uniref:Uncharacterized protein n=1 Tax=Lyophyllum shimeji TaxID=47721 RepID=A0A9P3UV66_LYOSH|nr:hypothetical protein LshimejAT787_3200080 [Lyophyllum shimeji]
MKTPLKQRGRGFERCVDKCHASPHSKWPLSPQWTLIVVGPHTHCVTRPLADQIRPEDRFHHTLRCVGAETPGEAYYARRRAASHGFSRIFRLAQSLHDDARCGWNPHARITRTVRVRALPRPRPRDLSDNLPPDAAQALSHPIADRVDRDGVPERLRVEAGRAVRERRQDADRGCVVELVAERGGERLVVRRGEGAAPNVAALPCPSRRTSLEPADVEVAPPDERMIVLPEAVEGELPIRARKEALTGPETFLARPSRRLLASARPPYKFTPYTRTVPFLVPADARLPPPVHSTPSTTALVQPLRKLYPRCSDPASVAAFPRGT